LSVKEELEYYQSVLNILCVTFVTSSVAVLQGLLWEKLSIQGGPKSKPLPNYRKVVLKPVNEIRFSRQIKV